MSRAGAKTKYLILVGDGMADYPIKELGGKTPLEVARTPHMDRIAACRVGLVQTIPPGMEPGSDIANLALLGYEPQLYHTGRAPLEAASMGVKLGSDQVAFRLNLVTLDRKTDDEMIMVSHSSGWRPSNKKSFSLALPYTRGSPTAISLSGIMVLKKTGPSLPTMSWNKTWHPI